MNILSLFDGISAGQVAFKKANIFVDNYYSSEIDEDAIKITQKNFPKTIQLGSIENWKSWNLKNIDFIIGGSPCQGFSKYGNKLNFDDPRSKLFFKFVEVLNFYKPKYFLLENVSMKNEWEDVISQYLGVTPMKINSFLLSAQNRERLYWTNIAGITQPKNNNLLLKDILENIPLSSIKDFEKKTYTHHKIKNRNTNSICIELGHADNINGHDFLKRIYSIFGNSPTLTAVCGGNQERKVAIDDFHYRSLTPLEYERIQTLPDLYTEGLAKSKRYKLIGNSFTVNVISYILSFLPK